MYFEFKLVLFHRIRSEHIPIDRIRSVGDHYELKWTNPDQTLLKFLDENVVANKQISVLLSKATNSDNVETTSLAMFRLIFAEKLVRKLLSKFR